MRAAFPRPRVMRGVSLFVAATMTLSSSAAGWHALMFEASEAMSRVKVVASTPGWSRADLSAIILAGTLAQTAPHALPPAPGAALPWQPSFAVPQGQANLATGNLTLSHAVTGWSALGPGVGLALFYNSQSARTGPLGIRWSHSYETRIIGTSPAVLVQGDGTEIAFSFVNGQYVAPAGVRDTLTRAANGSWTLTSKHGSTQSFDASGRLTAIADTNGNATVLSYGASGLLSVTDATGRSLTFAYSGNRLTSLTDPEGRTWSLSYDAAQRLTGVTDPALAGTTSTTSFAWDASNLVVGVTDRLGNTWSYSYGANGTFFRVTDPHGGAAGAVPATPALPDMHGFSAEAAPGTVTPDAVQVTYPVNTVAIAYVQDAGGNAREYGLDDQGRITASRDGLGHQTNFTWDTHHNQTSIVEPGGATTTMAYDPRGNLTSVTDPSGRSITRTYDARNNLLSETDPGFHTTTYTYDANNNLLSVTDPTNRTETRTYNPNGTLASMTDSAGGTTTFGYNSAGDRIRATDPLGHTTTWTYTLGRVTSRTDALGRTTVYGYDAWGRLTSIDYPQSVDQSFVYDREGRLIQAVDGTGTRTFVYDALGRRTHHTNARGTTVATYDAASRLTSQTDLTGRLIQYTYNANGQLTRVSDPTSWAAYTYDARGRLITVSYSNGTSSHYAYDPAGRVTSLTHRGSGGVVIASFTSTYDAAGRLIRTVEGPQTATTTFTYDAAGRLLSENRTGAFPYASTYTYNARGLRATAFRSENGVASHNGTYTYDAAGRLVSVADTVTTSGLAGVYSWNADGTLASMPGPGYRRVLSYDEEGRLTAISRLQDGVTTPLFRYGYAFDGGRRWRHDVQNNVRDSYVCGVQCGAGELLTFRSTDGGATWFVKRQTLDLGTGQRLGSVFQLFSLDSISSLDTSSSGAVLAQDRVDRFGVVRSMTGDITQLLPTDGGFTHQNGMVFSPHLDLKINPRWIVPVACLAVCALALPGFIRIAGLCSQECKNMRGWWWVDCMTNCVVRHLISEQPFTLGVSAACWACICKASKFAPVCRRLPKLLREFYDRVTKS